MKINSRASSYGALALGGGKERQSPRPADAAQGATGGASSAPYTVTLSGAPQPAPDADDAASRARVAAIREQLASGSYNISGRDVADKILKVLAA